MDNIDINILPEDLLKKTFLLKCELDIDHIIYDELFMLRRMPKQKKQYRTSYIYFKVKNINFEINFKFIIKTFMKQDDKFFKYIQKLDNFISNIKKNIDCELCFLIKKSDVPSAYTDSESESCVNSDSLLLFPFGIPHYNCNKKYSIKYSNNYISINDDIMHNCDDCIIELIEFIKSMAICPPYNIKYFENIRDTILHNEDKNIFDKIIDFKFPMYYGFNEIPYDEYTKIYKYLTTFINNNAIKYFPIYCTENLQIIKFIENLDNSKKNLDTLNTSIKYKKYYVILHVSYFSEVHIIFVPDFVFISH